MRRTIFAIAGYIGSGKSEAGKFLAKQGALFIDADEVVNDLYKPQQDGYRKIVNYFGKQYLLKNGVLNRKKLAKFVFNDQHKLKILNFLIHPLVSNEIQKILDKSGQKYIAIEATYFEKKHLLRFIDRLIWIDCRKNILLKRALKKKDLTEKMFAQIFKSQQKPEKIDFTVTNNGTKKDLYAQLKKIWQKCMMSA